MWRVSLDAIAAVLGIGFSWFIWRRLGESYALYTLLSVLLPATTNSTQSMARYVAVLFPIFMILAAWGRNSILDKTITIGFTLLLGILTAVFANWGFVG